MAELLVAYAYMKTALQHLTPYMMLLICFFYFNMVTDKVLLKQKFVEEDSPDDALKLKVLSRILPSQAMFQ